MALRVRWLGRVPYGDAHALQRALHGHSVEDHLLLLEHPHVYTLGVRAKPEHVLVPPASVGADLVRTDRGGDVTYHGPGQLVGYPVLSVPMGPGSTPAHVHAVEQVVIDALADLGLPGAGRLPDYPGVWVDVGSEAPRKICAVGVRITRGRSMHGFALNVDPDLGMFGNIVPCGIADRPVTSLVAEGVEVSMREAVDAVVARAAARWGGAEALRAAKESGVGAPLGQPGTERQDVAWRVVPSDLSAFTRGAFGADGGPGSGGDRDRQPTAIASGTLPRTAPPSNPQPSNPQPVRLLGRLAEAGVDTRSARPLAERKPEWLRVKASMGDEYRSLKKTMRSLDLVTVCEEAGCPNIFECWAEGTATFMINGERCTRACGFCLVDTQKPLALEADEPERVAEAVARMRLAHAVVTAVARDDLPDGGAQAFADTIRAIHARCAGTAVEVLISDCKGDPEALGAIFDARPEVLNHNLETVARLQRAVRPSASYARSLAVLGRAKAAGLTTKSGMILGMGETEAEVLGALADLRGVGVDIVTLGQYLRPTAHHLPVARWWTPEEFDRLRGAGQAMGFAHVEASPLTRSSYHAKQALTAAAGPGAAAAAAVAPTG